MAILEHPITGVRLNTIEVERKSLTHDEAITAHLLRQRGVSYHKIAHMLGTNPARLGEVLRRDQHPGAAHDALHILTRP